MRVNELWSELSQYKVALNHFPINRELVALPRENFVKYLEYFSESYNPLNAVGNYRTGNRFRHIHAVECGDYVEMHIDYFNPSMSIWLALPHLCFDVAPYFLSLWLRGRCGYTVYFNERK